MERCESRWSEILFPMSCTLRVPRSCSRRAPHTRCVRSSRISRRKRSVACVTKGCVVDRSKQARNIPEIMRCYAARSKCRGGKMAGYTETRSKVTYSVAPMLSVRQGARALEFYKNAFGATEVFKIESPDGAVVARLSVNGG